MTNPTSTTPIVFVDLAEVERRTGLRKSAIYARIGRGTFPRPVSISRRASRWVASEIDAWLRERVAERDRAA